MTLSLGRSTPDAMVDLVVQRIVETLLTHGTLHAHAPGRLDTGTGGREEVHGTCAVTEPLDHPRVDLVHGPSLSAVSAHPNMRETLQ